MNFLNSTKPSISYRKSCVEILASDDTDRGSALMQDCADMPADVIRPQEDRKEALPKAQVQVSDGEQPCGAPGGADKGVILDSDSGRRGRSFGCCLRRFRFFRHDVLRRYRHTGKVGIGSRRIAVRCVTALRSSSAHGERLPSGFDIEAGDPARRTRQDGGTKTERAAGWPLFEGWTLTESQR